MDNTQLAVAVGVGQALLIVAWVRGRLRPESPGAFVLTVAAAGMLSTTLAVTWSEATLAGVAFALVGGFGVAVGGQLFRGRRRERVTFALSQHIVGVVVVASLSAFLVVARLPGGTAAVVGAIVAASGAFVGLRVVRMVWRAELASFRPLPIGMGMLCGIVAGSVWLAVVERGSVVGAIVLATGVAAAAVAADLAVASAQVGRDVGSGDPEETLQIDVSPDQPQVIRFTRIADAVLGPACGFAAAAPLTYLVGVWV